jgi:hypothetical protein
LAQKRDVAGLDVPHEGHLRVVSALTGAPQLRQNLAFAGIDCPQCWQTRSYRWLIVSEM